MRSAATLPENQSPPEHASSPGEAHDEEDWSRRIFGPTGFFENLLIVARTLDNYAEADLHLFQRYGDVVRFRFPSPGRSSSDPVM